MVYMEYNIKLNNDDWKHLLIDSQILKVFKGPNSPTSTSTLNKVFMIVVYYQSYRLRSASYWI